MTDIQFT